MPLGVKVVDHGAVHQHLDLLVAGAEVGPLSGAHADLVGAGHREIHRLAHRAGRLEEADLAPLRGVGAVGGEDAAVGRHAGRAAEAPHRARRIILIGRPARPQDRVFKPGVEDIGGGAGDVHRGAIKVVQQIGSIFIAVICCTKVWVPLGVHFDCLPED